jgi:hypothetical protein
VFHYLSEDEVSNAEIEITKLCGKQKPLQNDTVNDDPYTEKHIQAKVGFSEFILLKLGVLLGCRTQQLLCRQPYNHILLSFDSIYKIKFKCGLRSLQILQSFAILIPLHIKQTINV